MMLSNTSVAQSTNRSISVNQRSVEDLLVNASASVWACSIVPQLVEMLRSARAEVVLMSTEVEFVNFFSAADALVARRAFLSFQMTLTIRSIHHPADEQRFVVLIQGCR
jgi:hypothetical protein